MAITSDPRKEGSKRKANDYFTQTEQRNSQLRADREKAHAADAAKTAKLRALRLAKEAADKEAAIAAGPSGKKTKPG